MHIYHALAWPTASVPPPPPHPPPLEMGSLEMGSHEAVWLGVQAGLIISGINAEVMPGQWEFQIGPVGPLEVGDQVHLARYLLHRLGEDFQALASFNPKPMKGDWNGGPPACNTCLCARFCLDPNPILLFTSVFTARM